MKEGNTAEFYAILVYEARSHKTQQLCICIQYFFHNEIKERLISMKDVSLTRDADMSFASGAPCIRDTL